LLNSVSDYTLYNCTRPDIVVRGDQAG
jgi:hypothetical protein